MLYLFLIEQDTMTRKVQARRVLQPLCTEMKVRATVTASRLQNDIYRYSLIFLMKKISPN